MSAATNVRAGTRAAAAGAGAAASAARYPHLRFQSDSGKLPLPVMLQRLEALGAHLGRVITITSGFRDDNDQRRVCSTGVKPCAAPGTSNHRYGVAADATIGGSSIQSVVSGGTLRRFGLWPLGGDPPHVELADKNGGRLIAALDANTKNDLYMAGVQSHGFGHVQSAGGGGGGLAVITAGVSLPKKALDAVGHALGSALSGLGAAGPVLSAIAGVSPDIPDPGGVAGAGASAIASGIVDLLVKAFGEQGSYAAVTAALVIGGGALVVVGAMRASGYPRTQAAPTSTSQAASTSTS